MKILILNGPNLNLLEKRDSGNYGFLSLEKIAEKIIDEFPKIEFTFIHSNSESELIDHLQKSEIFDGLVLNPGGYCHSSVGIRDTLEILKIPKIEVHLSNLASREKFRKIMLTTSMVNGYISGLKEISYFAAIYSLIKMIERE
ncbi:MAG: 3-dehydroquinate dehydratase [Ignavibacteriales bacterium]|nr:3-dehydroquinate dehydratase [Ignavibacteriales bacterium]